MEVVQNCRLLVLILAFTNYRKCGGSLLNPGFKRVTYYLLQQYAFVMLQWWPVPVALTMPQRTARTHIWNQELFTVSSRSMLRYLICVLLIFVQNSRPEGSHEVHNPLHNVSSPEFKALARSTYDKVIPCLESAWMLEDKKIDWQFPDDAEEHYQNIIRETAAFRKAPVHEYAGYEGPWIENIFIAKFMNIPLHRYNGLIPLFVQWIDSQILRGRYFTAIHEKLNQLLRPNVIYFAVSQGDAGLSRIGVGIPNILALSAGGFGHVILPLIKGEIAWKPQPRKYKYDIAFFGTVRQSSRPQMLHEIAAEAAELGMRYHDGYSKFPSDATCCI